MAGSKMEYNFLGKSGVKVSNLCLGTMTFGKFPGLGFDSARQVNEADSHKIMDKFASVGGNFIDTADFYSIGNSEKIVGSWLQKQDRNKYVVATKAFAQMDSTNVNAKGLSRRHIIEACEQSLERLNTKYIDLYQSHNWDAATPIEETLRTFDDLVRCGKIRYFGVCNVCGWQLQKIVDRIDTMGLNSCVTLQQQYNLICRQSELEEFVVCKNEGVGVLPWSPLKGGLLTGKYQKNTKLDAESSRLGFAKSKKLFMQVTPNFDEYSQSEEYWTLMKALSDIAKTHGKTVPQVAIRWLLQKDVVTSVIIGATSLKQLEDNVGASSGWELTEKEMKLLDEKSGRQTLYPHDIIKRVNADRNNPFNSTGFPSY